MPESDELQVRYIVTEAERKYSLVDRLPSYLDAARNMLQAEADRRGKVLGDLELTLRATLKDKP